MKIPEIYCYDLQMTQKLCKMGHRMSYVKRNKNNYAKLIYCFYEDETVETDLNKLIKEKHELNVKKREELL